MVKAVIGEESQLKKAENRLANSEIPAEVGLVIGKLSSTLDRGFVFDLIPTPANDAGEPACSLIESAKDDKRKGSKSKSQPSDSSSLAIDKDWVAEHARQVSRMLLGGVKVVGIYVWASDAAFKNSTITLCQLMRNELLSREQMGRRRENAILNMETVKGVAEAAPLPGFDWDERMLIYICYSPRRWACRNCSLASNITSSSLRPCDFKMGRVLPSLQTFRCTYNFDMRFPIQHKNMSDVQTLADALRDGITVHTGELKDAKALIDGNLVINDEPCMSDGLHEVELLLPLMKDTSIGACSKMDVVGLLAFSGSVCSFAYLNSKESALQAVADIKDDIIMSLRSRLDIICDEADDVVPNDAGNMEASDVISTKTHVSHLSLELVRKTCNLLFPRRVFFPWVADMYVCDYLQPSETLESIKDHCVELSMEAMLDTSTILEPEVHIPSPITKSIWDAALPLSATCDFSLEKSLQTSIGESSNKAAKLHNVNIMASVFFLILSMIVGFVLIFLRS